MKLSSYFHSLRSAYQAEIDDLTEDSEGHDVLRKRLAEKRREMDFLVKMIDLAPEMVAVVFHKGFRFAQPAVLQNLLACEPDDLPAWSALAQAVSLEPWAQSLAATVLREPHGGRFMVVAAALEFVLHHGHLAPLAVPAASDDEEAGQDDRDDDDDRLSADDARDPLDADAREEASDHWLAEAGFDRKD